ERPTAGSRNRPEPDTAAPAGSGSHYNRSPSVPDRISAQHPCFVAIAGAWPERAPAVALRPPGTAVRNTLPAGFDWLFSDMDWPADIGPSAGTAVEVAAEELVASSATYHHRTAAAPGKNWIRNYCEYWDIGPTQGSRRSSPY